MAGPEAQIIGQVEIALPGWHAVSGQIAKVPGEAIELDNLAIQMHGLVNEIIMEIRKRGRA